MASFTWNGQSSDDFGIILENEAPIIRAEERVTHIIIPGRAGDLTAVDGEAEFEPYLQTVTAYIPNEQAQAVNAWMRGDGYVTFSAQPAMRQRARAISQITQNYLSDNLGYRQADLLFYCQPLKELITEPETTVTFGQTMQNDGDVTEHPTITLTGTGSMTVSIDGLTMTVTGVTEEQGGAVIDTDGMVVTALLTGESMTEQSIGSFPVIPVGSFAITFTGATSCKVKRRKRWV